MVTLIGGVILYLALLGMAAGVVSLVKPLGFVGIRTRKRGLMVFGFGLLAFTVGVCLPVTETRVETARTRLDEFAPVYQFSEFHSVLVSAPKERVYAAIRTVRPEEIRFFKTLTRIRTLGKSMAPEGRPILESFTAGAFVVLADDPGREIVIGRGGNAMGGRLWAAEEFKAFHPAPLVKIVMNFGIHEVDASHFLLTTETRVYTVGPQVVRGFATYWRMIYPGSALIRRMWLRAIKLRAEAPGEAPGNPTARWSMVARPGLARHALKGDY